MFGAYVFSESVCLDNLFGECVRGGCMFREYVCLNNIWVYRVYGFGGYVSLQRLSAVDRRA